MRQTKAFAPGTTANHASHLKLFLSFTTHFELTPFPASLHTVLTFIEFLAGEYVSPKAVTNALASVRFYHERGGHSVVPFQHVQVRLAVRSLPFTMRVHVKRAPPFPQSLLEPLTAAAAAFGPWALAFRALVLLGWVPWCRPGLGISIARGSRLWATCVFRGTRLSCA